MCTLPNGPGEAQRRMEVPRGHRAMGASKRPASVAVRFVRFPRRCVRVRVVPVVLAFAFMHLARAPVRQRRASVALRLHQGVGLSRERQIWGAADGLTATGSAEGQQREGDGGGGQASLHAAAGRLYLVGRGGRPEGRRPRTLAGGALAATRALVEVALVVLRGRVRLAARPGRLNGAEAPRSRREPPFERADLMSSSSPPI